MCLRTAFVDRRRRPFGETPHQPDLIVSDFTVVSAVILAERKAAEP